MLADLEDADDVGVLDGRDRLGLGLEPLDVLWASTGAGANHLEGNESVEPRVLRLVDDAHPTFAQDPQDLVAGDSGNL